MARWTLDDIHWQNFDAAKVSPDLMAIAKAACMVEHNGYDYARYLNEVFKDEPGFPQLSNEWAAEEVQHGQALRRWAELADPTFDFDRSFTAFTTGYKLPVNVDGSVRGSRAGELIARCIVEIGTSSYYSAIRDATDEPVLKEIAAKIAADEVRHYKMFHVHAQDYLNRDGVGFWKRLKISLGRIAESEDDELAYAYYAAHLNQDSRPYEHRIHMTRYLARAYALYRRKHVENMVAMLLKVIGLKQTSWFGRLMDHVAWAALRWKAKSFRAADRKLDAAPLAA